MKQNLVERVVNCNSWYAESRKYVLGKIKANIQRDSISYFETIPSMLRIEPRY